MIFLFRLSLASNICGRAIRLKGRTVIKIADLLEMGIGKTRGGCFVWPLGFKQQRRFCSIHLSKFPMEAIAVGEYTNEPVDTTFIPLLSEHRRYASEAIVCQFGFRNLLITEREDAKLLVRCVSQLVLRYWRVYFFSG